MKRFAIIQYFEYEHLPEKLQVVSKPFCELAKSIDENLDLPESSETIFGLRKLLEAKDCIVRAAL
jgi:hypothetical protein